MAVDSFVKIVEALTGLFGEVAWPLLALFVILRFRSAIGTFFENLGEFSFKGAGLEASAKTKQIAAAANLAAAAATSPTVKMSAAQAAQSAADVVSDVLTNKAVRRAARSRILWVDDSPSNNIAGKESFEALGILVSTATSTDQALALLEKQRFDVVISDMGRPPDDRAGYTLLSKMRELKLNIPFLIYSGSGSLPLHREEASRHGALGSTSAPTELFKMALRAIGEN